MRNLLLCNSILLRLRSSSLLLLLLLLLSASTTNAIRVLPSNDVLWNATTSGRVLLGKKVDVPVPASPDDHLVESLPLLDNAKFPTKHWAGLLPASDSGHKYLFYWLFAPAGVENAAQNTDIPLLIWLNGGPACSSMDGLWLENGPFRLTKSGNNNDWSIEIDEFSWHNAPAYVLYLDQPVGTGLSFTTNAHHPKNDGEVNVDFYHFLQEFLKLHGDKFVDETITVKRPVYFSGESHAGHYIPSMMNYIHQQNEAQGMATITVPLGGGAIGNGWFDPPHQYSAHQVAYGYGMLGLSQVRALEEQERLCQRDLAQGKYTSSTCFGLLNAVVDNSAGSGSGLVASQYDQRKWEHANKPRDFPPGHKDVESFLGAAPGAHGSALSDLTPQVLEAIHATPSWKSGQRYRECTDPPYNALKHQDGLGVQEDVKSLLNANIRLLFFNGIHDLICNHVGNEIALEHLDWEHRNDYLLAKRYGWAAKTTGTLAGYMKEHSPLSFLKVLDSGHMVPMDLPEISLEMMTTFMYRGNFESHEQRLSLKAEDDGKKCPVCPKPTTPAKPQDCPACEACPTDAAGDDETDKDDDTNMVEVPLQVVGMATFMIGILGLTTLGACCYCCFCRGGRRPAKATAVAQYDLELPRSGYVDNFDDDDDDKISEGELS
jgi:carboxypeptidase D